jgi:hypothetical protein
MEGLCQMHYNVMQGSKQPNSPVAIPTPVAIQWTKDTIKQTFGAVSSTGDGSGGEYVGGGKSEWHVHRYNDGGAHIKVGTDEIRFLLKPLFKFDQGKWDEGVQAVRARAGSNTNTLLGAMAITLSTYGKLTQQEVSKVLSAL